MTFVLEIENTSVPLHRWYSPSRGDNFAQVGWEGGPGKTQSPGYRWSALMGYADQLPSRDTIPLYHWYNADRGDTPTTTHPSWSGAAGGTRDGYRFIGITAYVSNVRIPGACGADPTEDEVDCASFSSCA